MSAIKRILDLAQYHCDVTNWRKFDVDSIFSILTRKILMTDDLNGICIFVLKNVCSNDSRQMIHFSAIKTNYVESYLALFTLCGIFCLWTMKKEINNFALSKNQMQKVK